MHKILELYQTINQFGKDQEFELTYLSPGKIKYTFKVKERHLATPIAMHGGMLAAMMDALLGVTALSKSCEDDKLVSTIEFKIHYFNPVLLGDVLVGEGELESEGKRILITSGEIKAINRGVKVAKGMGTFNAYPLEKSGIIEKLSPELKARYEF